MKLKNFAQRRPMALESPFSQGTDYSDPTFTITEKRVLPAVHQSVYPFNHPSSIHPSIQPLILILCREPGRHSTLDKGHGEGGSAYANAGSSLRSPPGYSQASPEVWKGWRTGNWIKENNDHWWSLRWRLWPNSKVIILLVFTFSLESSASDHNFCFNPSLAVRMS